MARQIDPNLLVVALGRVVTLAVAVAKRPRGTHSGGAPDPEALRLLGHASVISMPDLQQVVLARLSYRPCKHCDDGGATHNQWSKDHGFEGPGGTQCYVCRGVKFAPPDVRAILSAILTTGRTKGGPLALRKSFSRYGDDAEATLRHRAYFVWRMARFHGGADVTLPMMAQTLIGGDPWEPELDALACGVAIHFLGTDYAAAARWAGVLSTDPPYAHETDDGAFVRGASTLPQSFTEPGVGAHVLPASACEHGPVGDGVTEYDEVTPADEVGEVVS